MKVISPKRLLQSVFPTVRNGSIFNASSLDLQFARTKTLDPRITFTRASSGTYVGSDGLIKTATTNYLLQSEDFSTNWANAFSVDTGNSAIAPNGTNTGTLLVNTADSQAHTIFQTTTFAAGSCSFSLYVKYIDHQWIAARIGAAGNQFFGSWDLLNGTTGSFTSGATIGITPAGGNWYRITLTATLSSTGSSNIVVGLNDSDSKSFTVYSGTGSGIYIWGAQLEQSSTVGEYIPTTSTINSAPRFDHDPTTGESLGLLVEEARTNSIRNNTMVGAVAGTPGTLPTNWNATLAAGISREVVAISQINGITCLDLRIFGTTTNTSLALNLGFEPVTGVASASGQAWAESIYLALIGGSLSGIAYARLYLSSTNGTSELAYFNLGDANLTSTLTRFSGTASPSTAGMTAVRPTFWVQHNGIGSAIDFTLRIGLPQLEQGAFATSVIPTTGTTATRSADVASITGSNFSSWYRQDEGTVFAGSRLARQASVAGTGILGIETGVTNAEAIYIHYRGSGLTAAQVFDNSVSQVDFSPYGSAVPANTTISQAIAFRANDTNAAGGGSIGTADTTCSMPTPDRLLIGYNSAANVYLSGTISRLTYWKTRLPNSTLQTITQ